MRHTNTHYARFIGLVEANKGQVLIGYLRRLSKNVWISQNDIKYGSKTGEQIVSTTRTWQLDLASIKTLQDDELEVYTNKKGKAIPCPLCGGLLQVDYEYMASTFGQLWEKVPLRQWSVFCNECEQAGPYSMLSADAKEERNHKCKS